MNKKVLDAYKKWCQTHNLKESFEGLIEYSEKHHKAPYSLYIYNDHAFLVDEDLDLQSYIYSNEPSYKETLQLYKNIVGCVDGKIEEATK